MKDTDPSANDTVDADHSADDDAGTLQDFEELDDSDLNTGRPAETNVEALDMSLPVTVLELSVRAENRLRYAGINTLAQLVSKTDADLLALTHFGVTCLREIRAGLEELGLTLGSDARRPAKSIPSSPTKAARELAIEAMTERLAQDARTHLGLHGDSILADLIAAANASPALYPNAQDWLRTPLDALAGGTADQFDWRGRVRAHLAALSDRSQAVLAARSVVNGRATLEEVGQKFDLTRERVRQVEANALGTLASDPVVLDAVHKLIGVASDGCTINRFNRAGFDLNDGVTIYLPAVARRARAISSAVTLRSGFEHDVEWVRLSSPTLELASLQDDLVAVVVGETFPAGTGSRTQLLDAFMAVLGDRVCDAAEARAVAESYIVQTDELGWDGDVWRYLGGSTADRIERTLLVNGSMTLEELCQAIEGSTDAAAMHRVGARLGAARHRFIRSRGRKWAVVGADVEQHKPLDVRMVEEITINGGQISLRKLQRLLAGEFSENSVSMYAFGIRFIVRDDVVRLRTAGDPAPIQPEHSRSMLRVVDGPRQGCWAFHFNVSYENLYAASLNGSNALCALLDVPFDSTRSVIVRVIGAEPVTVSTSSTNVLLHTTGGLRDELRRIGGQDGDRVRMIVIERDLVSFEVLSAPTADLPVHRLEAAIGVRDSVDLAGDVAYAVGLDRDVSGLEIVARLARRGEPTMRADFLATFPEFDV